MNSDAVTYKRHDMNLTDDMEKCVYKYRMGDNINDERVDLSFTQPLCGCTDEAACNFTVGAVEDDGSCVFDSGVTDCSGECYNDTELGA